VALSDLHHIELRKKFKYLFSKDCKELPNTTVVDSTLKEGGVCSDETLQQLGEFVAT
jgi:hypothetical protein